MRKKPPLSAPADMSKPLSLTSFFHSQKLYEKHHTLTIYFPHFSLKINLNFKPRISLTNSTFYEKKPPLARTNCLHPQI